MRGKGREHGCTVIKRRITPAHAGKSVMDFIQLFQVWDHPRTCGEKTKKIP